MSETLWFVAKVDDPAFKCFDGEPHWDVWRYEARVDVRRMDAGIFDGALTTTQVNVMCIKGEEADVRRLVALHNATLPSPPSGSAPLPHPTLGGPSPDQTSEAAE
jgi:hypothetical protein